MGRFIVQIPDWFPVRKAAQVTAFFAAKAGGVINVLRVTKLIYLADRLSMAERDRPITGDDLVSMPFGPVNTYTLRYMNDEAANRTGEWSEFIAPRVGYDIPLATRVDMTNLDELSASEIRILERTWDEFKDIEKYALADWTHKYCPEWRDPHGSSLPIEFGTVFKRLGKNDPLELAEEIQAERSLALELAGRA